MTIQRVALIYDDRPRPETTGGYCLRALRELVQVEHVLPDQLDKLPRQSFDLYVNIDDGLHYRLPPDLHPAAWWVIDTHLDIDWDLAKAHDFDFLFAAQRDGAERMCGEGLSTRWLPLACDPEIHRRHELPKEYDLCFVGNLVSSARVQLVELLRREFSKMFVGQRFFADMARTYSASRIVFNRSVSSNVNMRVFEAVACGSLLLSDDLQHNGQGELFRDGIHLATYRDEQELLDKVAYYLQHEDTRERIAATGRDEAVTRHTYRHRMQELLAEAERGLSVVASVPAVPPQAMRSPPAEPRPWRDQAYFEFVRPEILNLVPRSAGKVLDIGCAAGRLGEAIKSRQAAEVTGIEYDGEVAALARSRLDRVLVGDVEQLEPDFEPEGFDAIVCGDVLEHLREPEVLLRRARHWLAPGGRLVASIPNVRHWTVVRSLLNGNWTYEAAGLLDRDHVRFFTRRSIETLFERAGLAITQWSAVPGPGYDEWQRACRPGSLRIGPLAIEGISAEEAEEFYIYQYLVTTEPAEGERPAAPIAAKTKPTRPLRRLRVLFLGDFGSSWRHEAETAHALEKLGHTVARFHEYLIPSPSHVLQELNSGRHECLLFYKGRIGATGPEGVFANTGEAIAEVLQQAKVPCYTWYVDRSYGYAQEPSREIWMRRIAPRCRVAFVAEAELAKTSWARWHLLREPIPADTVQKLYVPEAERQDVAFLGQLYGSRHDELANVQEKYPVHFIQGVYGAELSAAIRRHRIILAPRYPCVSGYWGNRVYVVLGHGGFYLGPEIEGMQAEGLVAGTHYANYEDDPLEAIGYWLAHPNERDEIARAGQELVLDRFTYDRQVQELCRVIEETLP